MINHCFVGWPSWHALPPSHACTGILEESMLNIACSRKIMTFLPLYSQNHTHSNMILTQLKHLQVCHLYSGQTAIYVPLRCRLGLDDIDPTHSIKRWAKLPS